MAHKPFNPKDDDERLPSRRPARLASRVREELTRMIPGSLKDPRFIGVRFITITEILLTPDLKHANIQFALMDEEHRAKEIEAALNQASGFLRKELMHSLDTKVTPHLIFKYDKGISNLSQIETLLRQI